MKTNDIMHEILNDLSDSIELLEQLSKDKAFKSEEWQNFLARSSAQAAQLHGRIAYAFANSPLWTTDSGKNRQEKIR